MDTPDTQREARALGDPTRYRLFRYVAEANRPVGVAELTDFAGLNHNAVRQHLAVLKAASLVLERVETRTRPGRPALLYELHPEAAGKWETTGAYAWLAALLAEAVRDGLSVREVGYRDGQRRARAYRGLEGEAAIERELQRGGFRPERRDAGATVEYVLQRCPFAEVAVASPTEICQLHLGLSEGLADALGPLGVDRLVRKNPRLAGCRLVVSPRADESRT
ncbi:MAG TPA: helix-turn-helix domain-containing protein [Acidimicrobiales bacterium]|nr:helix-turn-helix domain-containing protein [Acidimicrobiales bacterium]